MDDRHTISAGGLVATIKAHGAELCSLVNADGLELIWQAGPDWPRHAPLLFPIVGRLKNDELRHQGKTYKLTQHGFARDMVFQWLDRSAQSCTLLLTESEATQARYPFAFRLTITYRILADHLELSAEIANPGTEILPASFGAHPAFNWPLSSGQSKNSYRLSFPKSEPAPIRRLTGGLMRVKAEPSPVQGMVLALSESLFDDDAVIMDRVVSHSVQYESGQGPVIEVAWNGFQELGIWSKPGGAPFLCIEPWRGFASPIDFDGEFVDKPGLMQIAPGATETLSFRVALR